jgi:single-stranded-DNA-specific exonuclease
MEIRLQDLTTEILRYMAYLEPGGQENPGVSFISRGLQVKKHRVIGSQGKHLKLSVSDGQITYDAIAFRQAHWAQQMPPCIDILYGFEVNKFLGRETLQLNVRDIKPSV